LRAALVRSRDGDEQKIVLAFSRHRFSHYYQPDRHAWLPQPVQVLLSRPTACAWPYRTREPRQVAEEFAADGQPYAVFIDNNLGSNRQYLRELCHALRHLNKIWSAAVTIDVTDDPSLIRAISFHPVP
jgi:hypothetical protein